MKYLPFLLLGCLPLASRGQSLSDRYAPLGQLIVTQFVSAPFPHPKRAEGHKYHEEFYPADKHYNDSTVAIFIPRGFKPGRQVDFVVHFHGWRNNVAGALERYKLIEQLVNSRRNAVLVVPQGPFNAPDSFGGKLEDPNGFRRFMEEVLATLNRCSSLKNKHLAVGQIILSGHSGGYQVISSIVDCGGMSDHVREVWLFDALYARTDKFLAWYDAQHGRLLDIYTEHGGTKDETQQLMATLKQRGTPFYTANESDVKLPALEQNKLGFIFTDLPHDEVPYKHQTFREFLETSCLRARTGD
ncbi:MAG TPA: hypothetical protein VMU04_25840 [Candidatus Acidoferrum sp.]|nr:hypothetical protein [Candidatus Acidoferrum sp.]